MSRTQSSCEVRSLTELSLTCFICSGWGVPHTWPTVNNAWRSTLFILWPTLCQTAIFTLVERQTRDRRSIGAILTLSWSNSVTVCYLFGVTDRFDWIKFDVWLLNRRSFSYLSRPKQAPDPNCHWVRLMWSKAFDPGFRLNLGLSCQPFLIF